MANILYDNTTSPDSWGGGNSGYPTADVENITAQAVGAGRISLQWTDPEDTVLDNAVLASWKSTIIVRKIGEVPQSIDDGVVILENEERNKYKDSPYTDTNNIIEGQVYYYRFFTKTDADVIGNNSASVKVTANAIHPILSDNTWEQISEAAESGIASQIWNIGDTIDITMSGKYKMSKYNNLVTFQNLVQTSETVTLEIWGFDIFDKSDGSGKAGIVFGSKHLLKDQTEITYSNQGTQYSKSLFHIYIEPAMYNALPSDVKAVVKPVDIIASTGFSYYSPETIKNEKVFLPSCVELGRNAASVYGSKLPIFTDNASRKRATRSGEYNSFLTMLRLSTGSYDGDYIGVDKNGNFDGGSESTVFYPLICFCV